jgi:crossover junction endodeoxyribonuclease RuvC
VAYGVVENKKSLRPSTCLVAIREQLDAVIREHRPEVCAVEGIIFVQSYKTAITMGAARGAAVLAAAEHGLEIFEYAPRRVKQAIVGRGGADKRQVAFMVRSMLGLTETPSPDAADALAIGLAHFHEQERLDRLPLADRPVPI